MTSISSTELPHLVIGEDDTFYLHLGECDVVRWKYDTVLPLDTECDEYYLLLGFCGQLIVANSRLPESRLFHYNKLGVIQKTASAMKVEVPSWVFEDGLKFSQGYQVSVGDYGYTDWVFDPNDIVLEGVDAHGDDIALVLRTDENGGVVTVGNCNIIGYEKDFFNSKHTKELKAQFLGYYKQIKENPPAMKPMGGVEPTVVDLRTDKRKPWNEQP